MESMEGIKSLLPILQIVSQGGLAIIIFVIWYFTYKKSNEITAEAFNKHETLNAQLIQLLKDEQEYKTLLTGTLIRIEQGLSIPAQCPILVGKKILVEVKE